MIITYAILRKIKIRGTKCRMPACYELSGIEHIPLFDNRIAIQFNFNRKFFKPLLLNILFFNFSKKRILL